MSVWDDIYGDGFERVFTVVKPVIDEWNPYGLLPDTPNDEFDSESRRITEMIKNRYKTISANELASVVSAVFVRAFGSGEGFEQEHCTVVAAKLKAALENL